MNKEQKKGTTSAHRTHRVCKKAAKELVKKAGNIDGAASSIRLNRSALADTLNLNRRDRYLPIDVLFDLECAISNPVATRIIAHEQGYVLFPIPSRDSDSIWQTHLNRTVRKSSRLFKHIIEALEDNDITQEEASNLLDQVDVTLSAIGALRGALVRKAEEIKPPRLLKKIA